MQEVHLRDGRILEYKPYKRLRGYLKSPSGDSLVSYPSGDRLCFSSPSDPSPIHLKLEEELKNDRDAIAKTVEDIEALSNVKIKNGQNAYWFLEAWERHQEALKESDHKIDFFDYLVRLGFQNAIEKANVEIQLTELQIRILEELSKEPMTAEDIEQRLLMIGSKRDLTTIKRALADLKKSGAVDNKRGLGYFRTDMPPKPCV